MYFTTICGYMYFTNNLRARRAVHVVNLLKLNHMESFILLVFFTQIKKSWATYPLLHTEYSAPRTLQMHSF